MSDMPPVTLLMLAWNGWDMTSRALESLKRCDLDGARVLVVDNGSSDATAEGLARQGDWIEVLRLPENVGFVRGINQGLAKVDPSHDVVLLNNDLVFAQPNWLQELRRTASAHPQAGIIGCRLLDGLGRLLHTGTYILPDSCWGQQIDSGIVEADYGQFQLTRRVQGVVFASAYIKRACLQRIGGLSEAYKTYFEDTDYCLRAAEAGFETLYCGSATIVHHEGGSTTGQDGMRKQLFSEGRRTFSAQWKEKLEARYSKQLHWRSIINNHGGYAETSRALMQALDEAGVRMTYGQAFGKDTPHYLPEPEDCQHYRLQLLRGRSQPALPAQVVVFATASVFSFARGKQRIGYTMLEVDGFPKDWVEQANQMDEIWVPSAFNRESFLNCGLKRPIQIMPLGVDPDRFNPLIRGLPRPTDEYLFLSCFEWGERKGAEVLLRAFKNAFRKEDPVRLIVKYGNRDPGVDPIAQMRKMDLDPLGGRVSLMINYEFSRSELAALYRSADCYVTTSRGEGWNLPLLEAMACGLPTIATDWSAHRDFHHQGIGYPLAVKGLLKAEAKCPFYKGFSWADPDQDHLVELLRHVFQNREEAAAKGRAASQEALSKWTWAAAADKIARRIGELTLEGAKAA